MTVSRTTHRGLIDMAVDPSRRKVLTSLATGSAALLLASALPAGQASAAVPQVSGVLPAIIPWPKSFVVGLGGTFQLKSTTQIVVGAQFRPVGEYLAARLAPATGWQLAVVDIAGSQSGPVIEFGLDQSLAAEDYRLSVSNLRVMVSAAGPEGAFRAVQTLRQLLPARIESRQQAEGDWIMPAVEISDGPRFGYRAVMLDPARRFVPLADVKRVIDQMALYKLNVLHLHLSDDQGWRIVIDAYPELTKTGASTQSGFAPGTVDPVAGSGPWFYTKQEYADLVAYAGSRFVEIVPEIDGPGHTSAALASIPEINDDGKAIPPYSGFDVGISLVGLQNQQRRDEVRKFLVSVLNDVAAQNPGRYLHIGGDESPKATAEQYTAYTAMANEVATAAGKKVIAWHEWIKGAPLPAGAVMQYWGTAPGSADAAMARQAVDAGHQLVLSPANRSYLDMKYDNQTAYGRSWAGLINLRTAWNWEPTTVLGGAPIAESAVLGVEASLWSDSANQFGDKPFGPTRVYAPARTYTDFMLFPRLPAVAELGWSPRVDRSTQPSYQELVRRVLEHSKRWEAMGIGYNKAADIPWSSR